jgi:hypothetical protein
MPNDFDPGVTVTGSFPSTHWSLIVKAGALGSSEDRAALAEICSLYWYPLYAFIRRKGNDHNRALDLTQSNFERLRKASYPEPIKAKDDFVRSYALTASTSLSMRSEDSGSGPEFSDRSGSMATRPRIDTGLNQQTLWRLTGSSTAPGP